MDSFLFYFVLLIFLLLRVLVLNCADMDLVGVVYDQWHLFEQWHEENSVNPVFVGSECSFWLSRSPISLETQ